MPRTKQTTNRGSSSSRDDPNIERWQVSSHSKHLYRRLLTSEPIFGKARASSSHGDPMDTSSIPHSDDSSAQASEDDKEGDEEEEANASNEEIEDDGDDENEDKDEEEEDDDASDGAEGHDEVFLAFKM
ncbi:uncharacterized protein LOC131158676 [Malania oleifera]|uniref:uncharacterized protein LOC131158676 n=1 Tax=Malania oleifera TaxID=397392 RepID=UPI0025AE8EC4|nr:uncharacterized protein LOC131158676 [Malania oleifera]